MNQIDRNLAKLPEKAYIKNDYHMAGPQGEPPVVCIKKGEEGYYPIYTSSTADELNKKQGVTKVQAEAMFAGSMFGWDCPGADIDNKAYHG